MKIRLVVKSILLAIAILPHAVIAAYKESADLRVVMVSVWSQNGDVLVQTDPRPDISGLTCSSDHWLVLNQGEPGYQAALSLLLAAQSTRTSVVVRAEDNSGSQFCKLSRVITTSN